MKKMLIIDGNSILNRAFYGIRLLTNKDGLYTNAIYGMVNILSHHIESLKPDYCAVAFDLKAPTFRHKKYDGYKANRKGMPEELAVQLPYAKECMRQMGMTVVECEGYEADDILGTLSDVMGKKGVKVFVLTGDRDSLQLINDNVSVLLAKTKETVVFDTAQFREQYGIDPSSFVDVKALMGDSSDNIPGVAGVGEKTALKLIADFGSVDALYGALDGSSLTDGLKKKLVSGKDMAYLSRELAEICRTAPIDINADSYLYNGPDKKELKKLFLKLDFTALLKKFGLDAIEEDTVAETETEETSVSYQNCHSITDIEGDTVFADINETEISLFDGVRYFVAPFNADNAFDAVSLLSTKHMVCYDSKRLYKSLIAVIDNVPKCYFDCMLAAYVLDSGRGGYSLEDLSVRYLSKPLFEKIPNGVLISELFEVLSGEIEQGGFSSLLNDIEMPLAYVLADMEIRGFKVDIEGINSYGDALGRAAQELQLRIYSYAGEEFNISSPKQLGEVLFEKMGLPKSRKNKTGYSTDAESLQKLINKHPIIEDILDYRQVTKLRSTYAEGLIKAADEQGRIHTVFNQTGTATGRLSSSEPNLQNIPVRTELGRQFRRFFIPKSEEYCIVDADYSQIELRLLAHISNDETMIDMFLSGGDIHTMTASRVFNVQPVEVSMDLRKKAKAVNFGIMYGIGEYSLSEDLGISRAQAKEYIDSYFEEFSKIKEYLNNVQAEAKQNGYVTTQFGRRRYIPELASSNKNLQHFGERVAMNSPIQGMAADIIKIAMIRVADELKREGIDAKLILQVHDELLLEAHKDHAKRAKEILVSCMENAVKLSVPLDVEAHIGGTWYEAK